MTEILYKIPVVAWVSGTAAQMEAAGVEDRKTWSRYWVEAYQDLGGTSTSTGTKECPMCAAHGLWYLGLVKGSKRPPLTWSVNEVTNKLGKNAAYAVIALRLLRQDRRSRPLDQLWESVRQEFKRETGKTPATFKNGAVELTVGLFLEGKLAA